MEHCSSKIDCESQSVAGTVDNLRCEADEKCATFEFQDKTKYRCYLAKYCGLNAKYNEASADIVTLNCPTDAGREDLDLDPAIPDGYRTPQ